MNNASVNSGFAAILESALNNPDSFLEKIRPALTPISDAKFDALAGVLETGGVVDRQLVARVFIEHTGKEGAAYLTAKIDIKRPKLFLEAAVILGTLKYEPALEPLRSALSGSAPELVLPAVKAIAMLPASRSVDGTLVDFYLTCTDETKLAASIRYLLARHENIVPEMLEKYRGLNADRRMWVLKFLCETANSESTKLFSEELDTEPLERGLYAVRGLGKIASEKAVEVLKKHLHNPEWFLRKRIVEALGMTGKAGAVEPLLTMLGDDSVQVRAAAAESLSKVGGLQPELLIKKLEQADKTTKINLVRVMGQLKNEQFIKPLVEVLKDREALFFSIDAIGDSGFAQAEFSLRRLLKDDVWFNRLNALEALSKLHIAELEQIAVEAAQDENDMVRHSAARILAALKSGNNKKS